MCIWYIKNDGSKTNEDVFWDRIEEIYGAQIKRHTHIFDNFYKTDFQKIKDFCGFSPMAHDVICAAKNFGFRVALATNPLFPKIATESKIRWAGLEPSDFKLYTTFETSHYCKPSLDYYRELCQKLNVMPEECLMVGNDFFEDTAAAEIGMSIFLITDCLINKKDIDISAYPNGSFEDLLEYIKTLGY